MAACNEACNPENLIVWDLESKTWNLEQVGGIHTLGFAIQRWENHHAKMRFGDLECEIHNLKSRIHNVESIIS